MVGQRSTHDPLCRTEKAGCSVTDTDGDHRPKGHTTGAETKLQNKSDRQCDHQDRGQSYQWYGGSKTSWGKPGGGYFLSYFVQYLSHVPSGGQEILLIDEPDAYLSMLGQQDLLRIFDSFADPEDDASPIQVVYVTHSPFLINKNHSERIRVLEKGDGEEDTRLVANAGRNHYEPLRSAFGAFVAETTFISNCNLMLEGQADQVLLAGISSLAGRDAAAGDSCCLGSGCCVGGDLVLVLDGGQAAE